VPAVVSSGSLDVNMRLLPPAVVPRLAAIYARLATEGPSAAWLEKRGSRVVELIPEAARRMHGRLRIRRP